MLTTTIGAYPAPDELSELRSRGRALDPGARGAGAMQARLEALFERAIADVVREQDNIGINILADGELRRDDGIAYHCRHLRGIEFESVVDDESGESRSCPAITGPVAAGEAYLVRDWQVAQRATRKPVKIALPGPLTIGEGVRDGFYEDDARARGAAFADALNVEIRRLADAGCPVIQIDEPALARRVRDGLDFAIEHLERSFHKVPRSVQRVVHVCAGHLGRAGRGDDPEELETKLLAAMMDPNDLKGAYSALAGTLEDAMIDAVSIEDAEVQTDLAILERFARTRVILGVVAARRSRIEEVEEVRVRLREALDHIDPPRLLAAPDCGLGCLRREVARRKLDVLMAAARSLHTGPAKS